MTAIYVSKYLGILQCERKSNDTKTYEQKYLNILIAETECADVLFS